MRINNGIYNLDAIHLARELLGKIICRNVNGKILKARITQTEAYYGTGDTACHAHKGRTKRTDIMFYPGGFAYIYLCYGIHYLLNIVSGKENFPEAVLIREAEPLNNENNFLKINDLNGPGKLTKSLFIDKNLNREDLKISSKLWLEDDGYKTDFLKDKRIGIAYAAKEDRDRLWRFILKNR